MPRPEKTAEIDRVLEGVIKHDLRRKTRGRRVIPEELIEAMDYYVRWGLASNRGRALIELAKPMATQIARRVKEAGLQSVREMVGEIEAETDEAPPPKAPRRTVAKAEKKA